MSAWSDLGPTAPTRMEVFATAFELIRLGTLARDLSSAGPGQDLPRAVATLDKARALLAPRLPTDDGSPACRCPADRIAAVEAGGTCFMGGCPYGGDR